jgi:dTDP-4-dehydrorhamnose 3,5-epimerase
VVLEATAIDGAFVIEIERLEDDRGFFARTFDLDAFTERGLDPTILQASISFNRRRGTLRGMHFQVAPAEETKLVRCTAGAVHDVIVDVRPDSPSYLQKVAVELSAENRTALYIPGTVAHGFQTLADDTEVEYQIGQRFSPDHARGLPYDDPAFGIEWPLEVSVISEKDRSWPRLGDQASADSYQA